jgi:hypothetical protein
MDQSHLISILNRHVFSNEERAELLKKITDNPDRYIGVFRSTTPQLKLIQNLLQSREIRFGDAMEEVVSELLRELGYVHQPKKFITVEEEEKSCDHYFYIPDHITYYLVEQKLRDDHDSTKKVGQFKNFRDKLVHLKTVHGSKLVGVMYFIDLSLKKNRKYYLEEMKKLQSALGIPLYLFYDGEFFDHLGASATWQWLIEGLRLWQQTVPTNIDLNYDLTPEKTLEALLSLDGTTLQKLITNNLIWEARLIQGLFQTGATLRLLHEVLEKHGTEKATRRVTYRELAFLLERRLHTYYGSESTL